MILERLARHDPRLYQIGALASLLLYGMAFLGFDVSPARIALLIGAALAVQLACSRLFGLRSVEVRSALISALSLCLLLRTNSALLAAFAAFVTIASKFLLRWNGKHVFNPTNFGLVATMLLTDRVWVSPGQWGSAAFFAFSIACAGILVVRRAARSDVTLAFLGFYALLVLARSLALGEPLAIPLHRLESGALLLFSFFMISDPKTTPDSRAGRILFALLVAGARRSSSSDSSGRTASSGRSPLFRSSFPSSIWSFGAAGTAGKRPPTAPFRFRKEFVMKRSRGALPLALAFLLLARPALPFCGFYVAKADTKLFNRASQVVLVRNEDRTVLTMANDFRGDPTEFAIVIPVPTFLTKEQIHVGDRALIDHLDAYSAPRLVEYFDPDPCARLERNAAAEGVVVTAEAPVPDASRRKSLGVTVEARYTVGEYDILILSAKESAGLETWLRGNGYRIPPGAARVLESYIKQNLRFFVAKVNLKEQARLGFSFLRPIQVAYESPKFMLPIRLGMVNADGPQELFLYALTRRGRVETTNYRTVKLPSDVEVPLFVKEKFADFYRALFSEQVRREAMSAVFLEYAWDMGWCDPCAAEPLSREELRRLGVFWLDDSNPAAGGGQEVFLSRLHLRYDGRHFPEDLVLQETADRTNFQGRYILRHAYAGTLTCEANEYREELGRRRDRDAKTLASLTGWKIEDVRRKMGVALSPAANRKWYEKLWNR